MVVTSIVAAIILACPAGLLAQRDSIPPGYPDSLRQELNIWVSREQTHPEDPEVLLRLSELFLNVGDDLYEDPQKRMEAYESGAAAAERLWEKESANAEAHFLYAANLGNLARLKGYLYGARHIDDIRRHVERTLALHPLHAQALQFLGGLLAELPWIAGGDEAKAQEYLEQAINIDGNFTNARILLAKLLIKQNRIAEARTHLMAVINADQPHYPYTWAKTFRPQAQSLLDDLKK